MTDIVELRQVILGTQPFILLEFESRNGDAVAVRITTGGGVAHDNHDDMLAGLIYALASMGGTAAVIAHIADERMRQDEKWGEQNHPDGTGPDVPMPSTWLNMRQMAERAHEACQTKADRGDVSWRDILLEEVYEALAERNPASLRAELLQVAAVAANWAEAIDRRTAPAPAVDDDQAEAEK
jgi:hypothetical protein